MEAECSYLEFNELSVNVSATDLRQNISDNGMVVAERYGFSVSNNNVNFSEFRYVSVIDSRCQNTTTDENGTLYVELKVYLIEKQLNINSSDTDSSSTWYSRIHRLTLHYVFVVLHSYPCCGGYFNKSESPEVPILGESDFLK